MISVSEVLDLASVFGRGGYKIADIASVSKDEATLMYLNRAYRKIATDAMPLELIRTACDLEVDEPLIFLDNNVFIAMPKKIESTSDNIELDKSLLDCFVYCFLAVLNATPDENSIYEIEYRKQCDDYKVRTHNARVAKFKKSFWLS